MARPFLIEGGLSLEQKKNAIASQTEAFLAMAEGDPIPGQEDVEKPEGLVWLEKIEQYGLPCSGGYNDQPYYLMMAVEAAEMGRKIHRLKRRINEHRRRQTMRKDRPDVLAGVSNAKP